MRKNFWSQPEGVLLIGTFKLLKGLLLLAIASGLLSLLDGSTAAAITQWTERLRADPHSHYFRLVMEKLASIDRRNVALITAGTFFYSAIFCTEGVGLLLKKRWAEYLTVIVTSSFLPLEIYEMLKHASIIKGIVITINAAIVIYLIVRLKKCA